MGHGTYSSTSRAVRSESLGYKTKSQEELFVSRGMPKDMDPAGLKFREARDSGDHPCSVPIIINLDVTGSMGMIPHELLKGGLPHLMQTVIDAGIPDPAILFTAIGDHECDQAPFQIGQFESSDKLLDHWLTTAWLEGNGGGNAGESYLLAWYAAAFHTESDHWDKRGKKGHLFTIGDEPTLKNVPAAALKTIFGPSQAGDMTAAELLAKAQEKYYVTHVHISETGAGRRKGTVDGWRQMLADNLVTVQSHNQVAEIIAGTICAQEGKSVTVSTQNAEDIVDDASSTPEEPLL